jgi:branched-chain amino acid transport system permease protein
MSQTAIAIFDGISLGGTYALIALGIIVIFRATDTFNFAHGQFMLLTAYLVGKWQTELDAPLYLTIPAGLAISAVVGWLLFKVVLRKIIGSPPFVGVIATLGFAAVADGAMSIIFGTKQFNLEYGFLPEGSFEVLGANIGKSRLVLAAISMTVAIGTACIIRYTTFGARLRAAGQDVLLASQSGINVNRVYGLSWALACALAGIAGLAYGATNVVGNDMVHLGLIAFPAILLGGMDSIEGSIIGGLVIGFVQSFTVSFIGGEWSYVTTYSVLLVVIMLRPSGLFGTKTIVRV